MSKREISIVLKAKNELAVGLAQARKELSDFGESVVNVGKWIGAALLAAGTALVGFATKAVASYAESEAAQKKLETAFRSFGEEVPVNVERVKQFTAAIEDQTGVDNLLLQARAAQLRMMGVQTSMLEQATKATIAAERAGMGEEQAIRAVAQALEGNFEAFNKYIPKLREAQTETEKAAIINDYLTVTYADQEATVDTIQGKWVQLKDAVDDIWVALGEAITQNQFLADAFDFVIQKARSMGEEIKNATQSGVFVNLTAQAQFFANEASTRFMLLSNTIHGTMAVLYDLASPFRYLVNVAQQSAKAMVSTLNWVAGWIEEVGKSLIRPFYQLKPPDFGPVINSYKEFGKAIVDVNLLMETATLKNTRDAQEVRNQINQEYANEVKRISDWQLRALEENLNKEVQATAAANAAKELSSAQTNLNIATQNKDAINIINDANTVRKEVDRIVNDSIKSTNINSASAIGQSWSSAYKGIADASIAAGDVAVAQADRVAKAMANTGFNEGLIGRQFETGGTGSDYQQAIANLRARGFQIGGVATPGSNIAGIAEIVYELQRIRAQNDRLLTFG